MKKIILDPLRSILFMAFIVLSTISMAQVGSFEQGVRQGRIKVKFSRTMTQSLSTMRVSSSGEFLQTGIQSFDAVAETTGAINMERLFPYDPVNEHKLKKHGLHLWYFVTIDDSNSPLDVVEVYKGIGIVDLAEAEYERVLAPNSMKEYTPVARTSDAAPYDDPMLPDQWHYHNDGQTGITGPDVNVYEAWATTSGASDVIVSIHDMGVDVDHEDLAANMWINEAELNGVDGVDDDENGYVDDIHGYNFDKKIGEIDAEYHGTHVAGTIAAVNNNGIGVGGVAGGSGAGDGAKIMSLQVMGGGSIENSYVYAANNGAVISQNSWGFIYEGILQQSILDAIDYFIEEAGDYEGSPMRGGLVVFAAGNHGRDGRYYPGYYENTLVVASTGPSGVKVDHSNYGEWIDITAPGGDMEFGAENGVLSTLQNDGYGYLQGTSMASPHVTGAAALALANRESQMTADELRQKLVTGVTYIDDINPDHAGMLGSGMIDAALAIKNDEGLAPAQIMDLVLTGVSQEFVNIEWTVPSDEDDGTPLSFTVYTHTEPITGSNMASASSLTLSNHDAAGTLVALELGNLLGLTNYYFAVVAIDRWDNASDLSNEVTTTTNSGPAIRVDANSQSISMDIDVSLGTAGSHEITIANDSAGVLRWNNFMRHRSTALAYNSAGIVYPVVTNHKSKSDLNVTGRLLLESTTIEAEGETEASAFTQITKQYTPYGVQMIGETDTTLTNSAATRFYVDEVDGFNLTQTQMLTQHDPAKGPMIVEVYSGETPTKENLIYAQEYSNWSADYQINSYVTLNEQLYFEQGSTFWIVFHVPSGNIFPLGTGWEEVDEGSDNSFLSLDMGATWSSLNDVWSSDQAWTTKAVSQNAHLGTYLVLEPGSGDVAGFDNTMTTLTADASALINGTYGANVVLTSNDALNQELRLPVTINVIGHQPMLNVPTVVDFGTVFQGTEKTMEFTVANNGYGNYNNPAWTTSDPQYTLIYPPWKLGAREEYTVQIKFSPTVIGAVNDVITISNGIDDYQIALFGVGIETSEMTVTPLAQTVGGLTIGDVVNASVTVENTGGFPLKYFVPGFDDKGVSEDWPTEYHSYGYQLRSSDVSDTNPIAYSFQDISSTGIDITSAYDVDKWDWGTVEIGFDFPFYGESYNTVYVAAKGFLSFDDSTRAVNQPSLGSNPWKPKSFISGMAMYIDMAQGGTVHYQVEPDRVIIQWTDMTDGWSLPSTGQTVLFPNGDMRFYYEDQNQNSDYIDVLIEDWAQQDGIKISGYNKNRELGYPLYSGLALGFDYPGPDIITSMTNGSGILLPGEIATVDITMATDALTEGITNRYINLIGNDPAVPQQNALVELDVVAGGTPMASVSIDTIAFGDVFQTAVLSQMFTIKNNGTANVDVTSMNLVNSAFTLTGTVPNTIAPGLFDKYEIAIPTATLATLEDWLAIDYADGSQDTIYVTGNVVDAPGITVDLTLLQDTLANGETAVHPLSIDNTGLADLEVVVVGKQWMTFENSIAPSSMQIVDESYAYEEHNDGTHYQWLDIKETGTQMPFSGNDLFEKDAFWRTLALPWPMEFYGQMYDTVRIGENGIMSFDEYDNLPDNMFFSDALPSNISDASFVFPYWSFTSFGAPYIPENEQGIFYEVFDEYVVISWEQLVNWFGGMGDPVSAQVLLYKNGTMKFQYKVNGFGSDFTSNTAFIGLQNRNQSPYVAISRKTNLVHGDGLAYVILPAERHTIAPGATLAGEIRLDATNIYGGDYDAMLKIQTNVPGSEMLEKQVQLNVTGLGVMDATDTVDFGKKMVELLYGSPIKTYVDVNIKNAGTAPFDITSIAMADGTQMLSLEVYVLVNGWFGPEWLWVNITDTWSWTNPLITLQPANSLEARAVYAPASAGSFTDDVVFTTSLGETRIVLEGLAVMPPAADVDKTAIDVVMTQRSETANRSIAFNNSLGQSDLEYEISIDYGRTETGTNSTQTTEAMSTSAANELRSVEANNGGAEVGVTATYNRTIQHGTDTEPVNMVGTGGQSPFIVATRFNSGVDGFNLTHVETWLRHETAYDATIELEVRAGGLSIVDATVVGTGTITLSETADDFVGGWRAIQLDEAAAIYPNEDFYVVIKYPFGIQYPQGIVNTEDSDYRFMYDVDGLWYDIQDEAGFADTGWLMYAAEETPASINWLSVTGNMTGTIAAGETSSIDLFIDGAAAVRGDQVAKVIVTTNDPANPVSKVPVSLHMNEAPRYANVDDMYVVAENDALSISIDVSDAEGNGITMDAANVYAGVDFTFDGAMLNIDLTPDYQTSGYYVYTFVGTDDLGASSEVLVNVEILHSNQAPLFVDPTMVFNYRTVDTFTEHSFADYFTDPDGDAMAYTAVSDDDMVVEVFVTGDKFMVKTNSFGVNTLTLTATDVFGAMTSQDVMVEVVDNNQAPVFNDPTMVFEYGRIDTFTEHNFADYFTDPDGDAMTYTAISGDEMIVEVYVTGDVFMVKANAMGTGTMTLTATDMYGAATAQQVSVNVSELVLGTENDLSQSELTVYPNPVSNNVNVSINNEWTGIISVTVVDLNGRVRIEEQYNLNNTGQILDIDMSNLASGMYILKVFSDTASEYVSIIKQ